MNNVVKSKTIDIETQDIIFVRVVIIETDKRKKKDVVRHGVIYKDEYPTNPIAWTDEEGRRLDLVSETLYNHMKTVIFSAKNEITRLKDKIANQQEMLDTYKTTYEAMKAKGVI